MPTIVRRRSVPRHFGPQLAAYLIVGGALGWTWPANSQAAKLDRYITSEDLSGRVVLDQTGQELTLPSAQNRNPTLPNGSSPTYLAIPLDGGEHLPSSLPILNDSAQPGTATVGPLEFDAILKAKLDTILDASKLAIVDTPSRNYLVEFLPGRVRSILGKQLPDGSTSNPVNDLTHLLSTGSNQLNKWTQSGMSELERFLKINSSKSSSPKLSLNLEAQLVGSPLAAPIPEPSTWLVFAGLIAGVTGLNLGVRRSRNGLASADKRMRSSRVSPPQSSCEPRAGLTCLRGRHGSIRPARADQCLEPRPRYAAGTPGDVAAMEAVR
jgi:hypothetical protein